MKWTPIVAMICISALEGIALWRGVDGAVFGIVIAALAGLGGFSLKATINKVKGGK
ncbi:hypothetical protein LCGC14_1714740 [marine sediment metagenome]|uniref:Uncharacterized protein n=1 Tax=marine sediment metagenome TaxID=412755 RepID=A0A0F9I1M8_9ZZZZ